MQPFLVTPTGKSWGGAALHTCVPGPIILHGAWYGSNCPRKASEVELLT
eukprot:COSAG02_NODE_985_length_15457_cov_108.738247_14_plen_49_part_00